MNDDENELVVTDDVPETTSEGLEQVETDTSEVVDEAQEESVESTQNVDEDIEKRIEERANKLLEEKVETRLIRERIKQEKKHNEELEKYKYLESIINASLGTSNLDEAISKTTEYYKEQGINVPAYDGRSGLTERQERILAEAEANEIKQCGVKEMEDEANRIASIPLEKRTLREKIMFKSLAEELISIRNISELKAKGYDAKVLDSDDFKVFKSKFSANEPITDIYEMYQKISGTKKQEPKSPRKCKRYCIY